MIEARAARFCAIIVLLPPFVAACAAKATEPLFADSINVGAAPSSPGWGDPDTAGNRTGFDHDLTNWLGEQLGFTPLPVNVLAKNRESELQNGHLKLVVSTYSITDARREKVAFAGPYMVTQQGFMIRAKERNRYRKLSDFAGMTICVTTGSTSGDQLSHDLGFSVSVVYRDVNVDCRADLVSGQVDAVSTDQLILFGLAKGHTNVDVPTNIVFGRQQRYGVGLPKGNKKMCEAVTKELRRFLIDGPWDTYFMNNLGSDLPRSVHKPDPNQLDPCL